MSKTDKSFVGLNTGMTSARVDIDNAIEVGDLDRDGAERLITTFFPPEVLANNIDFDVVCEEMKGLEPAFIMGSFKRAKSNAAARPGLSFVTTSDFALALKAFKDLADIRRDTTNTPKEES